MEYIRAIFFSFIGYVLTADWGYVGEYGPRHWQDHYEACGGTAQSPIDIPYPSDLMYDSSLTPFNMTGYGDLSDMTIKNNGHTVQVSIVGDSLGKAYVTGGGLPGKYIAAQLHFHWGRDDTEGSEHTFRTRKFPLELHIVHYNEAHGDLASSLGHSDGLAVLGFFFTVSQEDNENLAPMITGMRSVLYKDKNDSFGTGFDKFLASQTNEYYRYQGSLTTPPCSEAVVWTVFENKNTISSSQLAEFRSLYETKENQPRHHIEFNYRPIQPLGVRDVKKNYKSDVPNSFHWGYHGEEGPSHWKEYYQTCSGNKQSPINIPVQKDVVYKESLANLTFINYDQNVTGEIFNNGHTVQVNIDSPNMYIEGGGLPGRYKAAQFHFHWGHGHHGSEHTIRGMPYHMELHIVHFKEEYGTIASALDYTDGLAVVGFLISEGAENHHYKPIIDALPGVRLKGANNTINGFTLKQLTHRDLRLSGEKGSQLPFYRYKGGLTTPPCLEIVTWSVMMARVNLHKDQIEEFRKLAHVSSTSGELHYHDMITENYRPVQDLAGRTVYSSHRLTDTSGTTSPALGLFNFATMLFVCMLFR